MESESKRFPRAFKLNNVKEFQRVFNQACLKVQDKYFVILADHGETPTARLGMTVAKKNIAASVARSRIKRLVRESFRQKRQTLASLDIVVIVRRGTDNLTNQEMFGSLNTLWDKLAGKLKK